MNNLTQIIHKLEEECQKIAGRVIADNEDMNDPEFYDVKDYIYTRIESELPQYDLYQSIITILEKIDEGKMGKEINVFLCKRHGIKYEGVLARDIAKSLTDWLGGGE